MLSSHVATFRRAVSSSSKGWREAKAELCTPSDAADFRLLLPRPVALECVDEAESARRGLEGSSEVCVVRACYRAHTRCP